MKNIFNWICFILIVIIIVLTAFGCNTEKHVAKERVVVDSTAIQELKRDIAEKNSIIIKQSNKIRQLESLGVSFKDCPPAINVDSLRRILTEGGCKQSTIDSLVNLLERQRTIIKRLTDGTLEIQSNSIKELQFTKDKLEETISELKSDNEIITKENERLKTELKKETETKKVDKKSRVIGVGVGAFLLLIVYVAGIITGRKTKGKIFKTLKNKL